MKKMTVLLVALALLIAFSPAAAASPKVPVGDRISLITPPDPPTFAAGEPFHVRHGFVAWAPADDPGGPGWGAGGRGVLRFTLEVDGVAQEGFIWLDTWYEEGYAVQGRSWVYNFPDGLPEGPHEFTGHWMWLCLGNYVHDPSCEKESEVSVTIVFE